METTFGTLFFNLPVTLQRDIFLQTSFERINQISLAAQFNQRFCREVFDSEEFWTLWLDEHWPDHRSQDVIVADTPRDKAHYFSLRLPRLEEWDRALRNDPRITRLILRSRLIGKQGATKLAHNHTLTTLKLFYNKIGDAGAKELANLRTLTSLDLCSDEIGDAGATALAKNRNLTNLDLWNNQIRDAGAIALAENTTLTALCLTYNYIGDDGAVALAQNRTLTTLNCAYNDIGKVGVAAFTHNQNLTNNPFFTFFKTN